MITTFSSAILCSYAYQPEPLVHHLLWNIKSQYWWLWNRPELCNVCCWRDRGVDAEHGETIGSVAGTTDPEAGAVERRWRQRTPDTSGQWSPHSVCSPLPTFSHNRRDRVRTGAWTFLCIYINGMRNCFHLKTCLLQNCDHTVILILCYTINQLNQNILTLMLPFIVNIDLSTVEQDIQEWKHFIRTRIELTWGDIRHIRQ